MFWPIEESAHLAPLANVHNGFVASHVGSDGQKDEIRVFWANLIYGRTRKPSS